MTNDEIDELIDSKFVMDKIMDEGKKMIELTSDILQIIKSEKLEWAYISKEIILSEEIMRDFHYNLNWNNISTYQTLSEEFIREFQDFVQWGNISRYQLISEDFIGEFKRRLDFTQIYKNTKISLNTKLRLMMYFNNVNAPLELDKLYQEFLSSISDSISNDKIEAFVIMNKLTEE